MLYADKLISAPNLSGRMIFGWSLIDHHESILSNRILSPLKIATPNIVTLTLLVTPLLPSRKCDYNELKKSYLKLSLLQIVGYQNHVQL